MSLVVVAFLQFLAATTFFVLWWGVVVTDYGLRKCGKCGMILPTQVFPNSSRGVFHVCFICRYEDTAKRLKSIYSFPVNNGKGGELK